MIDRVVALISINWVIDEVTESGILGQNWPKIWILRAKSGNREIFKKNGKGEILTYCYH